MKNAYPKPIKDLVTASVNRKLYVILGLCLVAVLFFNFQHIHSKISVAKETLESDFNQKRPRILAYAFVEDFESVEMYIQELRDQNPENNISFHKTRPLDGGLEELVFGGKTVGYITTSVDYFFVIRDQLVIFSLIMSTLFLLGFVIIIQHTRNGVDKLISRPLSTLSDNLKSIKNLSQFESFSYPEGISEEMTQVYESLKTAGIKLREAAFKIKTAEENEAIAKIASKEYQAVATASGMIYHEVKRPVVNLKHFISDLKSMAPSEMDDYLREFAPYIESDADSATKMLTTLMNLGKNQPLNGNDIINLRELIIYLARRKKIEIDLKIDPSLEVRGAKEHIKNLFENLFDNALQALPDPNNETLWVKHYGSNVFAIIGVG